jgi:hypothetical protein
MKYALSAETKINLIGADDSRRPKISSIIPSTKVRTICSDLFLSGTMQSQNNGVEKRGETSSLNLVFEKKLEGKKSLYKWHLQRDR